MKMENMTPKQLFSRVKALMDDELYSPAKFYASILLSIYSKNHEHSSNDDLILLLNTTFWFGKCCYVDLEYERANVYFITAIHLLRPLLHHNREIFQKYSYIYKYAMKVKEKLKRCNEIQDLLTDIEVSMLPSRLLFKLIKFGNEKQQKIAHTTLKIKHPYALEFLDFSPMISDDRLSILPSKTFSSYTIPPLKFNPHNVSPSLLNQEEAPSLTELISVFPTAVELLSRKGRQDALDLNYESAQRFFEKVRSIDPWVMRDMDVYVWALKELGESDTMHRVTTDLFSMYPHSAVASNAMAIQCVYQGDLSKAEILLKKAQSVDPLQFMTKVVQGHFHLARKEFDIAFNIFHTMYLNSPTVPVIFYAMIQARMFAKSNSQDIRHFAHLALEKCPNNVPLIGLIGEFFSTSKNTKETRLAITLLKKTLEFEPRLASIEALCCLYLRENQFSRALEILEQYATCLPTEVLYLQRAYVYLKKKDVTAALDALNEALMADPYFKEAKDLLNELIPRSRRSVPS